MLFVSSVENRVSPLVWPLDTGAQAIVVLGGGRVSNAPEYDDEDAPGYRTLARLRYAARLHRDTGLPVLLSGGRPNGGEQSEAAIMAGVLRDDFDIPVKWLEEKSKTTAENAAFSARMLKPRRVRRIILVTDAMHMPRAGMMFAQNGFEVVAAPTIFLSQDRLTPLSFLPSGEGLLRTQYALREVLGILWYWSRHGVSLRYQEEDEQEEEAPTCCKNSDRAPRR